MTNDDYHPLAGRSSEGVLCTFCLTLSALTELRQVKMILIPPAKAGRYIQRLTSVYRQTDVRHALEL